MYLLHNICWPLVGYYKKGASVPGVTTNICQSRHLKLTLMHSSQYTSSPLSRRRYSNSSAMFDIAARRLERFDAWAESSASIASRLDNSSQWPAMQQ